VLARDLTVPCATIGMDDDALTAARTMAEQRLPGLVVCEPGGRPVRVLSGAQVLGFMVPPYVQDDVALARVIGERGSERLLSELRGKKVRDLLAAAPEGDLVVAGPDDTVLELCLLMAREQSQVIAVIEGDVLLGCVTFPRLLAVLLDPHDR
jgi:CBS domain-containing protein